jgi:hypothetical protein
LKTKEQELLKEVRRLEKRNKDMMDQIGEEQARLISITDAYDKTQEKMKRYKGQIEGAVWGSFYLCIFRFTKKELFFYALTRF